MSARRQLGVLRVGTHNVQGICPDGRSKPEWLDFFWQKQDLDIIFIQEHHLPQDFQVRRMDSGLWELSRSWKIYWSHNTLASDRSRAGVAILIRQRLLRNGTITVHEDSVQRGRDGRSIALKISWGGHRIQLASVYLPNTSPEQRHFITTTLVPLAQLAAPGDMCLWGGDFNFVHTPELDRIRRSAAGVIPAQPTSDATITGRHWTSQLPQLKDTFRTRCPTARIFTRFDHHGGARLDRFYVTQGHLQFIARSRAVQRPRCPTTPPAEVDPSADPSRLPASHPLSDHLLVKVEIVARRDQPQARSTERHRHRPSQRHRHRQRLPRLKLHFTADQALLDAFTEFVEELLRHAPAESLGPVCYIQWWLQQKPALYRKAQELNRTYKAQQPAAQAARPSADLQAVYQQLCLSSESSPVSEELLEEYLRLSKERAHSAVRSGADMEAARRRVHIHQQERPNSHLTEWLKPQLRQKITAMQSGRSGTLVTTPAACAKALTGHYARISATPPTVAAAQATVLGSLQPHDSTSTGINNLGEQGITPAEVERALKRSRRGTSAGPDGLPLELYSVFRSAFAPSLCRLYQAIQHLEDDQYIPPRFLDGLIAAIYKQKGALSDPASHRPITLLNTDYRLFAKILAHRLSPHLATLISDLQTAFVPGRSIGSNIWALQALPCVLAMRQQWGLAVFCDFRKAYDTVDRGFLLAAMETLGLDPAFIKTVRLLLTHTRAAAYVQNQVSELMTFQAGVRQGCPLSPLLYLFIGQALLCHLRNSGVGITPSSGWQEKIPAFQYADDTKALLESPDDIPAFLAAMKTFERACGQALEPSKTKLLPIGKLPDTGLPATLHGLTVTTQATALGVTFRAGAQRAKANWSTTDTGLLGKVFKRCQKLASGNLSIFGRGFATSGYVSSSVLYHIEFTGMPVAAVLQDMEHKIAKLVARDLAPNAATRCFTPVRQELLPGHPRDGGFGVLPLRQHSIARQAKWGLQLLTSTASHAHPWILLLQDMLPVRTNNSHPIHYLQFFRKDTGSSLCVNRQSLATHLVSAVWELPAITVNQEALPTPGAWCYAVPLWHNPALLSPSGEGGLEQHCPSLTITKVATLGDLVTAEQRLNEIHQQPHSEYRAVANNIFGVYNWNYDLPSHSQAAQAVADALQLLPQDWVCAARDAQRRIRNNELRAPTTDEACGLLIAALGWSSQNGFLPLNKYTVKWGTTQLSLSIQEARRPLLQDFATLAGTDETSVLAAFPRFWSVKWNNNYKAIAWLLAQNGIPVAQRFAHRVPAPPGPASLVVAPQRRHDVASPAPENSRATPCGCGSHTIPGREHHFWDCPVAVAVRMEICKQLVGPWELALDQLQKPHLWLGESPGRRIHRGVWAVTCLAALNAMESGRKYLYAQQQEPHQQQPGERLARGAIRSAMAKFWSLLADFTGAQWNPAPWHATVPEGHPFLEWNTTVNRLRVNRLRDDD